MRSFGSMPASRIFSTWASVRGSLWDFWAVAMRAEKDGNPTSRRRVIGRQETARMALDPLVSFNHSQVVYGSQARRAALLKPIGSLLLAENLKHGLALGMVDLGESFLHERAVI